MGHTYACAISVETFRIGRFIRYRESTTHCLESARSRNLQTWLSGKAIPDAFGPPRAVSNHSQDDAKTILRAPLCDATRGSISPRPQLTSLRLTTRATKTRICHASRPPNSFAFRTRGAIRSVLSSRLYCCSRALRRVIHSKRREVRLELSRGDLLRCARECTVRSANPHCKSCSSERGSLQKYGATRI